MAEPVTDMAPTEQQPQDGLAVYGLQQETAEAKAERQTKEIENHFKTQAEQAQTAINSRKFGWKRNVELRQGNPLGAYGSVVQGLDDDYQSEINPDWYLSKTKIAALFSQVPEVQITHQSEQFLPAVGPFAKGVNYELGEKRCATAAAMAECMADLVNASGFCAAEVGYATRTTVVQVSALDIRMMDPAQAQQMIADKTMPMRDVTKVADYRFFTSRISPVETLLPAAFNGSDFDQAPWVGRKFRTCRADARDEWKLSDEQLNQLQSDDVVRGENDLKTNRDGVIAPDLKTVTGKRLYYWRYRVDSTCLSFSEIWELVWLDGIPDPVYHGLWKGQQRNEQTGAIIGPKCFPIRVCTTVYISDNPIPPSDTQAGRPQVNDMRRSRSQMFQNRAFSMPMRWFNTDKTDPMMHDLLMKGQFQGMVPVQGDGTKMMGEVARASYPGEDLSFDKMASQDLDKMWMLGPNQMGQFASHEVTKGEATLAQSGFDNVMGYERKQVAKFFLSIVEVLSGLMALYSDFPNLLPQEKQQMQSVWDTHGVPPDLAFTILPGTQIVVNDAEQINRDMRLMNLLGKSGYLKVKDLAAEIIELHGKDPARYITEPSPKPAKPATVTFTFRGREDLQSPVVVAILQENGQFPPPEKILEAKKMLEQLGLIEMGVNPGAPPQLPPAAPPEPGSAHPDWNLMPSVAKRERDI